MTKKPKKPTGAAAPKRGLSKQVVAPLTDDFDEVLRLIDAARTRAVAAVNTTLIELYWSIGEYISQRIAAAGWGKGTVAELAEHIRQHQPTARGYSASNLWRMMQFFETYRGLPKLAPLVRELSWTHNLLIIARSKRDEEREFYLRMAAREKWGKTATSAATRWRFVRASRLVSDKTLTTVARIASRRSHRLQRQLSRRVPESIQRPFRVRLASRPCRKTEGVFDRTRPRFLLHR